MSNENILPNIVKNYGTVQNNFQSNGELQKEIIDDRKSDTISEKESSASDETDFPRQTDEVAAEDTKKQFAQTWRTIQSKYGSRVKVFFLTLICVITMIILLLIPEETLVMETVSLSKNKSTFEYDILKNHDPVEYGRNTFLRVYVKGYFLPQEYSYLANDKLFVSLTVDLPRVGKPVDVENWALPIASSAVSPYMNVSLQQHDFDFDKVKLWDLESASIMFKANVETAFSFQIGVQFISESISDGVLIGFLILLAMYILIMFEVVHATVATMLTSTVAVATLAWLNERPSLETIMTWLDIETLVLLFSMMVLVSIFSETGIFDYLGLLAYKTAKGKVWPLITALCTSTAVLSSFLDNVTTVLLMTPITIQLCEVMGIDPVPVLIATVIFSNIGGTATAVGDPPNVLIASNEALIAGGVNFTNFSLHMTIGIIFVFLIAYGQLRFMYRHRYNSNEQKDEQLRKWDHEIEMWKRSINSLSYFSRDERNIRKEISEKIKKIKAEMEEYKDNYLFSKETYIEHIRHMEETCKITDKVLLIKCVVVILSVVVLFMMSNWPVFNLSLGWCALTGAITLLILADTPEVEAIFARVEWTTLIFFACLFVIMETLNKLGLLLFIANQVERLILTVPEESQLLVALLLILWTSGLVSTIINNIPFTQIMIPIVLKLNLDLNIPLLPMVYALGLGTCLGGNGTIIGASANVVCAGIAEQQGYKFSFLQFLMIGFPITIVSLIVSSIYLIICHVLIGWNN